MDTKTLTGGIEVSAQDSDEDKLNLYFDIVNEHSINVQNQITDNYLENNTAVQDNIAHSPLTITVNGLIGELVYSPPEATYIDQYISNGINNSAKYLSQAVGQKLGALPALLPPVSNAMQLARNKEDLITDSIKRYKKILMPTTQNRLREVYSKLMSLRNNNTAFIVKTPFATFENMYIQSLTLTQGNENFTGDISITLKELRFTEVSTTAIDEKTKAQYNAIARAKVENNGKMQGETVSGF